MSRSYPPDWLDDGEAAYLLSLPVSSFRQYVSEGVLPKGVTIGKHRRWSRAMLHDALAARGVALPGSDNPLLRGPNGAEA